MKRYVTGDIWTDAKLLRAEELVEEARTVTARRALLRRPRPPRRGVRVRLGVLLLAVGHRLVGSVPASATNATGTDPQASRASWNRPSSKPGRRASSRRSR